MINSVVTFYADTFLAKKQRGGIKNDPGTFVGLECVTVLAAFADIDEKEDDSKNGAQP